MARLAVVFRVCRQEQLSKKQEAIGPLGLSSVRNYGRGNETLCNVVGKRRRSDYCGDTFRFKRGSRKSESQGLAHGLEQHEHGRCTCGEHGAENASGEKLRQAAAKL